MIKNYCTTSYFCDREKEQGERGEGRYETREGKGRKSGGLVKKRDKGKSP
jgi:hypothetical protein